MKLFFASCLALLLVSCSQESATKSSMGKSPLKGLQEASSGNSTTHDIVITDTSIIYDAEGVIVPNDEAISKLISGDFVVVPYINAKEEMQALVLREATDEEKERFKARNEHGELGEWLEKEVPSIAVKDIHNNNVDIQSLKGKVVVMNFWFIECKPCLMEIPELNKVVNDYSTNQDVVFLAFAENNKTALDEFLTVEEFDYQIIPSSEKVSKMLGVKAYPTHMVIDKEGKVAYTFTGYGAKTVDALRNEINTLMRS